MAIETYVGVENKAHKVKNIYVGVDGVARKVKAAYAGVDGVARYVFIGDGWHLMDKNTIFHDNNIRHGATCRINNGSVDYLLFAGGSEYVSNTTVARVDVYDSNLTRTTASNLSEAKHDLMSASLGTYAVFAGGENSSSRTVSTIDAYDVNLTRTKPRELRSTSMCGAGTSVGNYIIFAGGYDINSSTMRSTATAYNKSLTRSSPSNIYQAARDLMAINVGNYALFAGGNNKARGTSTTYYTSATKYNASLTRSSAAALGMARSNAGCASNSTMGIITTGYRSSDKKNTYITEKYDASMTKTSLSALLYNRCTGITLKNHCAFFSYGYELCDYNTDGTKTLIELFHRNLQDFLNISRNYKGGVVGDYALIPAFPMVDGASYLYRYFFKESQS